MPVHRSTQANSIIAESKFKAFITSEHIEKAATALLDYAIKLNEIKAALSATCATCAAGGNIICLV